MVQYDSNSVSSRHSSLAGLKSRLSAGSIRLAQLFHWGPSSGKSTYEKRSSTTDDAQRPQCHGWRPRTLRWIILAPFIATTVTIGVSLAFLQLKSDHDGGLFFADNITNLRAADTFLYLYFPTVVAVLYSTGWSWIDLDAKRLEPWFQLSKSDGAKGEDSLTLQYPIEFIAFVPFRAAKKGHWTIVCASTILMIVFWAITPLQSGIFATRFVSISTAVPVARSDGLIPLANQSNKISTKFLNAGYGILWLGQPLPPYTTKSFALAPFSSQIGDFDVSNGSLTSKSTLYGTDLKCYPPATFQKDPDNGPLFSFDNGKGCHARDVLSYGNTPGKNFSAYYVGYFADPNADSSLEFAGCPSNATHTFLAVWMTSGNNTYTPDFHNSSNATALFCESSYHTQEVEAKVKLPGYAVIETSPLGPKRPLDASAFNITQFEYILGAGVGPYTYLDAASQRNAPVRQDIPDATVIHQDFQLSNMSLVMPTSNMVGFAVGASHLPPSEYLRPDKLEGAFREAHQLLFALAVQGVMTPPTNHTIIVIGEQIRQTNAVLMVRVFTILVEVFLIIVVFLAGYFAIRYGRKSTALLSDPNTLTDIMSMSRDLDFRRLFYSYDSAKSAQLHTAIRDRVFVLGRDASQRHALTIGQTNGVPGNGAAVWDQCSQNQEQNLETNSSVLGTSATSERPLETSWAFGSFLILILTLALAAIIVLQKMIQAHNGLPIPSQEAVIQQILLNYIPTVFATLIEPVLVLLNRWLCILQPYEDLRRQNAPALMSISTRYTSIPPQLVFWRSLRVGHVILAALSATAILANVLTISLSGLFIISWAPQSKTLSLRPTVETTFVPGRVRLWGTELSYSQSDPRYIAMANLTSGAPLPPWLLPEYYFLPVDLPATLPVAKSNIRYIVNTTGIAVDPSCHELTEKRSNAMYQFDISRDGTQADFLTTHQFTDGNAIQCTSNNTGVEFADGAAGTSISLRGMIDGRQALEFVSSMKNMSSSVADISFCRNLFVAGWIRANISWDYNKTASTSGDLLNISSIATNKTFIACQPRLQTGEFKVEVDRSGAVIRASHIGPLTKKIGGDLDAVMELTSWSMGMEYQPGPSWHNDTFATDWTNYLMKESMGSNTLVDAYSPVPGYDPTARILTDIYQRIFATHLSLKANGFVPTPNNSRVPGIASWPEQRIFMSDSMFKITVSILAWDILIILLVYLWAPPAFLPRLPTSIASNVAYFAASYAVKEIADEGMEDEVAKKPHHHDMTAQAKYGFGRFTGTDGKVHVGIERAPFVMPLDDKTRRRGVFGRRRLRIVHGDASEVDEI